MSTHVLREGARGAIERFGDVDPPIWTRLKAARSFVLEPAWGMRRLAATAFGSMRCPAARRRLSRRRTLPCRGVA